MSEGFVLADKNVRRLPDSWFRGARIGQCFMCGGVGQTYDIKAMNPSFRCCKDCIQLRGVRALKNGADEATAAITSMSNKTCRHCGEPVMAPSRGLAPLVCKACWEELRAIAQG